ncbi:winged helix-turn-helix transcriptional regulator [Pedobacter caeni]|uniref:Transcriptional regulator, HxlR family n=1 Tax=Pedobacter caeni TaxID=288992 RepID=A0A1M5GMP2_9SPHI|nr:helix-turn-helix domain-containing protein [Pedobacter caeni]SHG04956.1 transcriptional regulator, HxlR family [Pedobacter caeni]
MAIRKNKPIDLQADMKYLEDTMYVISGKWKMKIILALICGSKRYREIAKAVPNITFRMLSKELKQLEQNKLISRTVTMDNMIQYEITGYAQTLAPTIIEMIKWGKEHRENIKN